MPVNCFLPPFTLSAGASLTLADDPETDVIGFDGGFPSFLLLFGTAFRPA